MKKFIKEETNDFKEIWRRIRRRDFRGNTGLAIKNSIYQFLTTSTGKGGSLLLTVILARLLMPELFGLYSLALATIILFASFADLGVNQTAIRFISKTLGKKKQRKAKGYLVHLLKLKVLLIIITSIILIISAKFISDNYYQKPLFFALIAGSLYIITRSLVGFVESTFQASNKFNYNFSKELFFQIVRLILVPLVILVSLNYLFSNEINLFLIILALSVSYFLTLIFVFLFIKKKIVFLNIEKEKITKTEKRRIRKFILPLSVTVLSGVFFGYIDMIMLGKFVLSEYIGYYGIAFSLIGAGIPLITFSNVLLPIFSRIRGRRLERALKKSVKISLILSLSILIITVLLAPFIIKIIFGIEYTSAIPLLRLLSLLLISGPITAIYTSYLISKGETSKIAKLLVLSTLINIVLNYVLIVWLLNYGYFMAVVGATMATLISRYFYLFGLVITRKKKN